MFRAPGEIPGALRDGHDANASVSLRGLVFDDGFNTLGERSAVTRADGEAEDVAYLASGKLPLRDIHQLAVPLVILYPDPSVRLAGWLADKGAVALLAYHENRAGLAALLALGHANCDERERVTDG